MLRDVSFTAKQGQVTALVGPSGGGKSTVAKLAAKFYPLDGGRILLGGTDIAPLNSTMLMKISLSFSGCRTFNNTIMENIRVGKKTLRMRKSLPQQRRLSVMNSFQNCRMAIRR